MFHFILQLVLHQNIFFYHLVSKPPKKNLVKCEPEAHKIDLGERQAESRWGVKLKLSYKVKEE